jgi:quinoprotein glucose dehydrogenase
MREVLLSLLCALISSHAAEWTAPATTNSAELDLALKKLRLTPGFSAEIFAAEPLIQNPTSFTFDEHGRAFVVETHRRRSSVFDIRNHPDWLDADFSFRTVADRSNFFRKVLVPANTNLPQKIVVDRTGDKKFDARDLEVESERIRLVIDENRDRTADKATTFADNFKTSVSGVAAGVLARKGDVYFTCIPDLWLLRDANNDQVAEFRKSLAHGFGVHISFGGHDLHGLKIGPDGKLYFSIADRGLNVTTASGKKLENPDSGAILRCNLDGSDLELYATGLRNPQELTFDQHGNLWTGENNGDGGDKARWLYVVEGGDYGWHLGWQHLPKMGAWNAERLWELSGTNTAAYVIPPVAHIGHGPAGVAFYPGTGLPPQYRNHLFMCDFPGGIQSFSVQNRGAGFDASNPRQFLWDLYPVDVDFGPDGGLYVLDWVQGWEKTGKGRLFRIFDEKSAADPIVAQTRTLLAEGMTKRAPDELGTLLAHADMRVRLEAQFELAGRGADGSNILAQVALNSPHELARLHGIWGLGQFARTNPLAYNLLFPLMEDTSNPEVRAQATKVVADSKFVLAFPYLARAAQDANARVRYFGILGLGKLSGPDVVEPIIQALRDNNDADPFLRHAGVMAITYLDDPGALETAARDSAPAVRLAALLAMRRMQKPEIAMFLYESRPQLILEAARAIYDTPIQPALTQLASMIQKPGIPKAAMRRALHANYRLGRLEHAMALSEFASNTNFVPELRADAIELLGRWAEITKRDLFLGLHRPATERDARAAAITFRSEVPDLLKPGPAEVRLAAVNAAVQLDVDSAGPALAETFKDKTASSALRVESLKALGQLKYSGLGSILKSAGDDPDPEVRKVSGSLQARLAPGDAVNVLLRMLENGDLPEKQSALEMLGGMENKTVDAVLLMWLDRATSGKAPRELHMEILDAAAKRSDPMIKSHLQRYNASRGKDPMKNNIEALAGGDPDLGKKIFFERQDVQCLRCHKIDNNGGIVGPDLTGVGKRLSREELLESILLPNNRISKGFESLVVKMQDGSTHVGLLRSEDAENVIIESPEDGLLKVPKAEIADLNLGLSSMPPEIATALSKQDLRNLIEFLASQK